MRHSFIFTTTVGHPRITMAVTTYDPETVGWGTVPIYLVMLYILLEVLVFVGITAGLGFGWATLIWLLCTIGGMIAATRQMQALAPRLRNVPADKPGEVVATAALTAAGAVLLALPGIVTTVLGILVVWSPTQRIIQSWGSRTITSRLETWGLNGFTTVDHFRGAAVAHRYGSDDPTIIDIDVDESPHSGPQQQWPPQVEQKDDDGQQSSEKRED
ncbi:FxsA family protein [Corynebacterium renale]|uniref:FxsA family protein n=1 Tax=Corynebacterium renale TaxID=1724 RepID=UPI000DBE298C|nr:FxsA family protein [Corynebacterium renale]